MATAPEEVRSRQRRQRKRKGSLVSDTEKKNKIFQRVKKFYDDDKLSHDMDRDIRLQRYAKLRMWVEGKDFPWDNASDIPLSDMMEKSLRLQDTIHNAVMSARPPITANALNKADKEKEKTNEDLLDFQFFEESPGEKTIGDMGDAFVNDGVVTVFVPWVKDHREVNDMLVFDPIPDEIIPVQYFSAIITRHFNVEVNTIKFTEQGWDATVSKPKEDGNAEKIDIKFYTRDNDDVEMVYRQRAEIFNGPRPIVLDYDDVLCPARSENLQIPSPSNPGGASHVIIIDHPSVDEIKRLAKSKFYDLLTDDQLTELENITATDTYDDEEEQRDTLAGRSDDPKRRTYAKSHTKLTRLVCFDCYDIDGDGIDEDVIWWVILEAKVLAKAVYLTAMYPGLPPKRPFAEASFLPVRGRRVGISMLEMLEGIHDVMKAILDQSVDAGTIANTPFFFYSNRSALRPEVIELQPGEGYPVPDASRDVNFPQVGNPQAQGFAINMITMLQQMEERSSMIGDVQFGRVPPGRASALRTVGGMALLSGQGEARPERIMRRFFTCLSEVWSLMHRLNQYFLPKNKQYRIVGPRAPEEDPYQQITRRTGIAGRFDFTYKANVLNTSKQQMQQSIQLLMQTYINQITLQLGLIDPEGIYRLLKEFGKTLGHDPDDYLRAPSPDAMKPRILAEEAIQAILNGTMPEGVPMELGGAAEHLQKLNQFIQSDGMGALTDGQIEIFREYLQIVMKRVEDEARKQQLLQASNEFQSAIGGDQGGRPPENVPSRQENPQVSSGNELIDETLPGAGGGGEQ